MSDGRLHPLLPRIAILRLETVPTMQNAALVWAAVAAVSDRRINTGSVVNSSSMPDHLKRLDSIYQHSPIYFVTTCAVNRRRLFANEAIHSAFKIFADSGPNYGAWLGAYVLMPDHLHLFVAIDDQRIGLSAWMKSLKGTLSSELHAKDCASPYWQKDFSTTSFGARSRIQKSGNMFEKIPFALDR
jgi:REP element-mobilizing transposase RayT